MEKITKGKNDIVSGVHCLRQAFEHFASFSREYPGAKAAVTFTNYNKRLDWIAKDILTHPYFSNEVREAIRDEWESDVFAIPDILDKISRLNPENRNRLDNQIDTMLKEQLYTNNKNQNP